MGFDGLTEEEKKELLRNFSKKASLRPPKHKYYLDIAREVSMRSTCNRRQYGAVIVKDDEIIATGYNGAARGEPNCIDIGICQRELNNIPHGKQYEDCVAVHAEQNAIISASRNEMLGGTLYLFGREGETPIEAKPCKICKRMIKNAGLKVYTEKGWME